MSNNISDMVKNLLKAVVGILFAILLVRSEERRVGKECL